jgi:hypothetical protein
VVFGVVVCEGAAGAFEAVGAAVDVFGLVFDPDDGVVDDWGPTASGFVGGSFDGFALPEAAVAEAVVLFDILE